MLKSNINSSFFKKPTVEIAKNLLGMELIYMSPKGPIGGIISETEAYTQEDPACHAFEGKKTKRNEPMFLSAGHIYIYFIYGMYHCLNIVTEKDGIGAAVLIRELIPTYGLKQIQNNRPKVKQQRHWLNGPGKLMLGLGIPSDLNKQYILSDSTPLKLIQTMQSVKFETFTRIGISKGTDKLWRFRLKEVTS